MQNLSRLPEIRPSVSAPRLSVLGTMLLCALAAGCSRGEAPARSAANKNAPPQAPIRQPGPADPATIPLPEFPTRVVRVVTPEPGFRVFVDQEPVRTSDGGFAETPCAVTLSVDAREVLVARACFADAIMRLPPGPAEEVTFSSIAEAGPRAESLLGAPYLDSPVGEPIALETLNSSGAELDPYVAADGLSIWFVGRRSEGTGIYVARRNSRWQPFGAPEYLSATGSLEVPATPSLALGGDLLVYAVPERQRIYAWTRSGADGELTDRRILQFGREPDLLWPSCQLLPDGLRLYWTVSAADGGKLRGQAAVRRSPGDPFSRPLDYPLPGLHPCLSADGLRQYAFDGKRLQRARRADLRDRFSALETIATLDLPDYASSSTRRPFFVSDDEQWLFYSSGGEQDGDLHMVRLFDRPHWGVAPLGEPIAVEPRLVSSDPPVSPDPAAAEDAPTPRSDNPESYADLREQFLSLLRERRYDAAEKLVETALTSSGLAEQRNLLHADREDLEHIRGFWSNVRESATDLKPGDLVRIGSARLELARADGDALVFKTSTGEVAKKLAELEPGNLTDLVDARFGRDDAQSQLRSGVFLFYDGAGSRRSATSRLERAGPAGRDFLERQAERLLALAEQNLENRRTAAGLQLAERLLREFPQSRAASRARELQSRAVESAEWEPQGPRKWASPSAGEYVAEPGYSAGSWLLSAQQYENFELTLEWKAEGPFGQGGVFFRYPGRGELYGSAFKVHLANDYGLLPDPQCTGSLFNYQAPEENAVRRPGEWNTLTLRVRGESVEVNINGRTVLDTLAINEKIPSRGFIALDGISGGIAYRKILLVELPPE